MMKDSNITLILSKLGLEDREVSEVNDIFCIKLQDSDEAAEIYSKLEEIAENTGFPFVADSEDTVERVVSYFEIESNKIKYNIFLESIFIEDIYYLKISKAEF